MGSGMGAQEQVEQVEQAPGSGLWARRAPADAAWDAAAGEGLPLGRIVPGFAPAPLGAPAVPSLRVPLACLGGAAQVQQLWWGGLVRATEAGRTESGLQWHWTQSDDFLWICVEVDNAQDLLHQGQDAYELLLRTAQARGMPRLLRFWNYLPHINAMQDGEERYQSFNRGRRRAFRAHGQAIAEGAPAACALGTHQGVLRVALLAGRRAVVPIENPRQVSAYHYPRQYGEEPPIFSRAAWLRQAPGPDVLFISGTASIVGHQTVHAGDVLAQTRESVRNIQAVLQGANGQAGAPAWRLEELTGCVYVRHAGDYPLVRACLDELGLGRFCYLQADICRGDLLVEIEAEGLRHAPA